MRQLKNKTNVIAPGGNYPYGRLKDNPGNNTGTPVDENLLGDASQFFERLMAEAGITPNGQPENSSDGFQLVDALKELIKKGAGEWKNTGVTVHTGFSTGDAQGVMYKIIENSRTIVIKTTIRVSGSPSLNDNILTIPIPQASSLVDFDFLTTGVSGPVILKVKYDSSPAIILEAFTSGSVTPGETYAIYASIPY